MNRVGHESLGHESGDMNRVDMNRTGLNRDNPVAEAGRTHNENRWVSSRIYGSTYSPKVCEHLSLSQLLYSAMWKHDENEKGNVVRSL